MNLQISGHHLEITPALHDYVTSKLERVTRHFDNVIDVNVILSVEKLEHKAEATINVSGRSFHAESVAESMYAAIDLLADKLDRQILKHKEKITDHHRGEAISHDDVVG